MGGCIIIVHSKINALYHYWLIYFKCLACPAGYIGFNCSSVCNEANYGLGCAEICECDQCHHIYGCNFNETPRGKNTDITLKTIIVIHLMTI